MCLLTLRPKGTVLVNGQPRRLLGGNTVVGTRAFVATASLRLDRQQGEVYAGDAIQVQLGYGALSVVFSGEAESDAIALWPNTLAVQCSGFLGRTQRPVGVPGEEQLDEGGQPLPLKAWANLSDGAIVRDILALYGVPIDAATFEERGVLLGTVEPVRLGFDQPGFALIQAIDRDFGYRTFDGPDGLVRRMRFSGVAKGTLAFREGVDLVEGSRTRSRRDVVNRVNVRGLEGEAGLFPTPTATVSAPSRVSPTTKKPYIPSPPTYAAESHSSSLLETEALCEEYAARVVGEKNRLREEAGYTVVPGQPRLRAGSACTIAAPHLDLGAEMAYFVEEVSHQFEGARFSTSFVVLGGYTSEGVNPNQPPVAVITYKLYQETMANGTTYYVVIADGSESYDPDGQTNVAGTAPSSPDDPNPTPGAPGMIDNGIASYAWGGTLGTPTVSNGGKTATYVGTADPNGLTITLVVTDASAKLGDATVTVNTKTHPALIRDLWAAEGNGLSFTKDGSKSWQYFPGVAAVGVCQVAAREFNLAWDAAGKLYRCLSDLTHTIVPVVGAVTAGNIRYAAPETVVVGERCWVGCADGSVHLSTDKGLTFALVSTIPGGGSIRMIEESPFAEGDLVALSGNKVFHSFDAGATWAEELAHGQGLEARWWASGYDKGFAIFAGTPSGAETGSRIRERAGRVAGDWNANSAVGPVDKPAQPSGVTYGTGADELFVVGAAPDGTHQAWHATSDQPFTLARRLYDAAANGAARHIIRDGFVDGVIYGAAEKALFKTFTGFVQGTVPIKNLVAPATGWMIGYGDIHSPLPAGVTGDLLVAMVKPATGEQRLWRLGAKGWTNVAANPLATWLNTPKGVLFNTCELSRVNDTTVLASAVGFDPPGWWANLPESPNTPSYRSTDNGATWTAITGLSNCMGFVAGRQPGEVYALNNCIRDDTGFDASRTAGSHIIARSTDGGATFTDIAASTRVGFGLYWLGLAVHPTDGSFSMLTTAGVRWTLNDFTVVSNPYGPGSYAGNAYVATLVAGNSDGVSLYGMTLFDGIGHIRHRIPDETATTFQTSQGGTGFDAGPKMVRTARGIFYGRHALWHSPDEGATWAALTLPGGGGFTDVHTVVEATDGTIYVLLERADVIGYRLAPTAPLNGGWESLKDGWYAHHGLAPTSTTSPGWTPITRGACSGGAA